MHFNSICCIIICDILLFDYNVVTSATQSALSVMNIIVIKKNCSIILICEYIIYIYYVICF